MGGEPRGRWGGRLHGFTHLPGLGPASSKIRGPLDHIAVRLKDLTELPASVRPPDHARPQPGQDTDQSRSTDLNAAITAEWEDDLDPP